MQTPLMTLSGDNIVEASILKPTEGECGTFLTLEEEVILLGKEVRLPEVPGSLLETLEIPKLVEPPEQTNDPSTSPHPSPVPQPSFHPSQKAKNPRDRLGPIQTMQESGFTPTCRRMKECQNGGASFYLFSSLRMSASAMSKSKGWPNSKLQPSGCQPHN